MKVTGFLSSPHLVMRCVKQPPCCMVCSEAQGTRIGVVLHSWWKQLMGIRHLEGLDLRDFAYGRSKAEKQWQPMASIPSLMDHLYSFRLNVTTQKWWVIFSTAGYVEVTCTLYCWQKCVDFFPCFCRKVSFIDHRLANNKNPRLFTG